MMWSNDTTIAAELGEAAIPCPEVESSHLSILQEFLQ